MFAPELESDGGSYPQGYFEQIRSMEEESFWFRARNRIIQRAVSRHLHGQGEFLEVGCGTGFVLEGLRSRFPGLQLAGSELSIRGLLLAAARVNGVELLQMDARSIPYVSHFDGIGIFDVIEHIEEDQAVLSELFRSLRPGGILFITVPQHPFLWSSVDVFAKHVRRYRRQDLLRMLKEAGFEIRQEDSFVSLLLPLLVAARWMRGRDGNSECSEAELRLPTWVDRPLAWIMRLEELMMRAGISFPAGGSLLIVARRPQEAA